MIVHLDDARTIYFNKIVLQVEFINKYVPKDARLHLIGHSIGSWMILNMMKDELIAKRVTKSYLLFPTVERMAESPNGRLLCNVVRIFFFIIFFLYKIFFFIYYRNIYNN